MVLEQYSNEPEECVAQRELLHLPDEIIEFILTYLPPYQDLKNSSLVCKRWQGIVQNLVRRSKYNLHKGLQDFRLRWEVFTAQTALEVAALKHASVSPTCSPHHSGPTPIIAGRFSHSAVRHSNAMYIFGGGSSSDTTFNDLWRFDLSKMCWERPLSMGNYPSPKGSASMVQWKEQLILFGGWRYPSLHPPYQPWCLFDELHYYDLNNQRWSAHVSVASPPSMAGHSASVHGDRMIIFGGYQIIEGVNSNSNETWCLDLHTHRWWQPRFLNSIKPPPRYGQFQLVLDEEHLLVVGGCGGPNAIYSDAWLLDMSSSDDVWSWRSLPVRNKKYAAPHMWCNPACKLDSKLVVLGPTPNMPQDFQLMKQTRVPVGGGLPAPRLGAGLQNQRNNALDRGGPLGNGNADALGRAANRQNNLRQLDDPVQGPGDQYYAQRRAILNQNQQQQVNNPVINNNLNGSGSISNTANNSSSNSQQQWQPRTGRLQDLHAPRQGVTVAAVDEQNQNRPSTSAASAASTSSVVRSGVSPQRSDNIRTVNGSPSNGDMDAANRLQRNLALRCRENEPLLPKRFDEVYEDPFRMAAFNVPARSRSLSKDHNERIRRMEEKMNALRNSRRNAMGIDQRKSPSTSPSSSSSSSSSSGTAASSSSAQAAAAASASSANSNSVKEPSPKRVKRNVLSLFVCDLSAALDAHDPHLQWLEYKNYGILPGAPERLILSTMVVGHGELILFGGVHKETLSEITHQVSNTVHFLSAPRDIV